MIFILIIFLFILTVWTYFRYGRDLLSPAIWLLFGYDASVLIAITQYDKWGDISLKTVLILGIGIIAYLIGCSFGDGILTKRRKIQNDFFGETDIVIKRSFVLFSLVFLIVVAYFNYMYINRIAHNAGFSGGFNFLTYARVAMDEDSMPYGLYIPVVISQAFAYVIMYDLIRLNVIKNKNSNCILEIGCIALYLAICLLSTGRTMLLHFLIYVLAVYSILLKSNNNWNTSNNKKIIKYGVVAVVIILAAFWIIDSRLRASMYGTERTMWNQISKYAGSSIYAFDQYLANPYFAGDTGKYETFYNIFSILNRFGFDFKIGSTGLSFVRFSDVSTNIYTALRRYIHDFGYLGMVFIQFLIGVIYQNSYKEIKNNNASLFSFFVYCTFVYAVVFNCIEERFIVNVLSLRSLILIFSFYFILSVLNGTKIRIGFKLNEKRRNE